jgi:hypothetical protein
LIIDQDSRLFPEGGWDKNEVFICQGRQG